MGRLVKGAGFVVRAPVLSAKDEAARILAGAREERDRAQADAARLRQDAERAGHDAGFASGREAGLASCTETLAAARVESARLHEEAKGAALTLARRMAEKIVGRAFELSPDLVGDVVGQALSAARARSGPITVRVHPDDLDWVEKQRPGWSVKAGSIDVHLKADPAVGRHGCVVETPVGRLDARLDAQLDAFERALRRGQDGTP